MVLNQYGWEFFAVALVTLAIISSFRLFLLMLDRIIRIPVRPDLVQGGGSLRAKLRPIRCHIHDEEGYIEWYTDKGVIQLK